MDATLQHILSVQYTTLGISVLVLINQVLIFIMRDKINGIGGPRSPLPVINYGFHVGMDKLNVWMGKRKTYKTPDIMPKLEQSFARWIHGRIHSNLELDFREVELEKVMAEFGCPNINTLRKLLQRFESLGILAKKGAGNSTRKLTPDGYLKNKNLLPTTTSPTAKAG